MLSFNCNCSMCFFLSIIIVFESAGPDNKSNPYIDLKVNAHLYLKCLLGQVLLGLANWP